MELFENTYFNIVDIIIISIILISCVVATFRGFIKEAFSIISWIFALIIAIKLYEKFKLELIEYISHKVTVDIVAFGFPFLTTLFISSLISTWLSPKFTIPGLLIFDKIFGLIFGILRGILLVTLFYLGLIYLLGKEKSLPSIVLDAHTFNYITTTANLLRGFVSKHNTVEHKKVQDINREDLNEDNLLKDK